METSEQDSNLGLLANEVSEFDNCIVTPLIVDLISLT